MKKQKGFRVTLFTIVILMFVICAVGSILTSFNDTEYVVTVTNKDRVYQKDIDGNTDSKYLVYCDLDDGGTRVFENTDTFIRGKWNSSDFQGRLKVGSKYKITVVGYRLPFFSSYENIIRVEEVE